MKFLAPCILVLSLFATAKIFAHCSTAFSFTQVTSSTLQFTNIHAANEDSTTTFVWTFGDGDSALTENPLHTFTDTGWFNVCLHIHIGSINCSSDTCMPVRIVDCKAYYTYVYDPTYEQPEASVYLFTDSSQGEDSTTTYGWVVGGGDLSAHKNLAWTFEVDDAGPQSVCLTIKNTDNSCISTYCDTFEIHPLCPGDTFAYTQQGSAYTFYPWACGYFHKVIWDFGDGTIDSSTNTIPDSLVHNYPSATDSYYVCLTVDYDSICQFWAPCTAIFCHTISPAISGINAPGVDAEPFMVYPNPADKTMMVSISRLALPGVLEVYDVTGRKIRHFVLADKITELDIAELSSGIYLLEFDNASGGRATGKLVKE